MENSCKNCGTPLGGKFCAECGQRADTRRFVIRDVLTEVQKQYIQLDRGFFYTILALATRPGHAIREYLDGKRVGFSPALKFLFWTAAIAVALMLWLDLDQAILERVNENYQGKNGDGKALGAAISGKIFNNPGLLMLLMLPGITLGTYLFFRNKKYYPTELFILNCYLTGAITLTGIVNSVVSKVFGPGSGITMAVSALGFTAWLLYFTWGYRQFFEEKNYWSVLLKTGLSLLLGILVFMLITVMVALLFIR